MFKYLKERNYSLALVVSCFVQNRHTHRFGGDKHMANNQNNMA